MKGPSVQACQCPYSTMEKCRCLSFGESVLPDTSFELPFAVTLTCISSTVNSSVCQRRHRAFPLALQCIAALSHVNTGFHYALKLCVLGPCGPPRLPGSSVPSSASASSRAPSSFCQQLSCCGAVEESCRLLCSGGKTTLWFHALPG